MRLDGDGNVIWDGSNKNETSANSVARQLCNRPVDEWSINIQAHLTTVMESGLVGLFDTPYPYLSHQVLELAKSYRIALPIITMTERDPRGWANSRSKNHGLLVCQKEYSFEKLGASEFDILGCVRRAYNNAAASLAN